MRGAGGVSLPDMLSLSLRLVHRVSPDTFLSHPALLDSIRLAEPIYIAYDVAGLECVLLCQASLW